MLSPYVDDKLTFKMGDSLLNIGYSEFRPVKSTLGTVRYILVGMSPPRDPIENFFDRC